MGKHEVCALRLCWAGWSVGAVERQRLELFVWV